MVRADILDEVGNFAVSDLFGSPQNPRTKFSPDLKKEILKAQGGKCMYCGARQRVDLMDIDHKNPLARGGSNSNRNLQLLCHTCNNRKGTKTDKEFRHMYKHTGIPQTPTMPSKPILQSAFASAGKVVAADKAKRQRKARNQDPLAHMRRF